ncbi:hypothetical protein JCM3765_005261 [Sporobolomyces pararoseus]
MAKQAKKRKAPTTTTTTEGVNPEKKQKKRSTRSTSRLLPTTSPESEGQQQLQEEPQSDAEQRESEEEKEVAGGLLPTRNKQQQPEQQPLEPPPPPTGPANENQESQHSDTQEAIVLNPTSNKRKGGKGNRSLSPNKQPRPRRIPIDRQSIISSTPVVEAPQPGPLIKKRIINEQKTESKSNNVKGKGEEITQAQEQEKEEQQQNIEEAVKERDQEEEEEEGEEFGTKGITSKEHPPNHQYGKRARSKSVGDDHSKEKEKGDGMEIDQQEVENQIEDENSGAGDGYRGGDAEIVDKGEQTQSEVNEGERAKKKQRISGKKVVKGKGKGKENQALFNRDEDEGDADTEEQQGEDEEEEEDGNETDYDEPPHVGGKKVTSTKTKDKEKKISKSVAPSQKKGKGKQKKAVDSEPEEEDDDEQPEHEQEEEEEKSNKVDSPVRKRRQKRAKSTQAQVYEEMHTDGRTAAAERREKERKEKRRKQARANYKQDIPQEDPDSDSDKDPDRCNNPKRLKSFTKWSRSRQEFVPYKIWLHPVVQSWKKDDGSNELIPREKVVQWVEENGGQVVGDQLKDLEKCQIAVVPEFHIKAYKRIFETASLLDKIIVKRSWILQTLELRDDEEAPGFHENPYHKAHQAPVPHHESSGDESSTSKIPYRIKEEEELYWLKLAERVEKRKDLTRSEMARKMEKKFRDKYDRSEFEYKRLYPQFLIRMLDQKKARFPAPKKKKDRKRLEEMKLFTSSESDTGDDGEEGDRVEKGGEQQDQAEDKENRGGGRAEDRRPASSFQKNKKSKYMMEMEAREARQKEEEEEEEGTEQSEEEAERQLAPMPPASDFAPDNEEEIDLESLSKEYPLEIEQIQGISFYTTESLRRTKKALDLLKRAKETPSSQNPERLRWIEEAQRHLFSKQVDGALLDCQDKFKGSENDLPELDAWQRLKSKKEFSDEEMLYRLRFLASGGAQRDPRTEEGKQARRKFWYPTSGNL